MTTFEEETRISTIIKNSYDCDIIISDNQPFTIYNSNDISKILNFGNIRSIMRILDDNEKIKISKKTNGGDQKITYITFEGLRKIVLKSRKIESIDFSNLINLDKKTKYYCCIETDIMKCIITTFDGNLLMPQYRIDKYMIDLYFPEYLLAIECDELQHNNSKNKLDDEIRSNFITNKLGCRFIRFNVFDKNFNLFKLLNEIYIHLSLFPRK